MSELASTLHQIAGVAAFFGQVRLGEESCRLETSLRSSGANTSVALLSQMRELFPGLAAFTPRAYRRQRSALGHTLVKIFAGALAIDGRKRGPASS